MNALVLETEIGAHGRPRSETVRVDWSSLAVGIDDGIHDVSEHAIANEPTGRRRDVPKPDVDLALQPPNS